MLVLSRRFLETQQTVCSEVASKSAMPFLQYHMDVHQLLVLDHRPLFEVKKPERCNGLG